MDRFIRKKSRVSSNNQTINQSHLIDDDADSDPIDGQTETENNVEIHEAFNDNTNEQMDNNGDNLDTNLVEDVDDSFQPDILILELNRAFCFSCKLFTKGNRKGYLANEGYSDWAHLGTRLKEHETGLKEHETSADHVVNMTAWYEPRIEKEKDYWRKVLFKIVAIVKFLAKHNLAFRGSNSKLYDDSNGNFLGLVEMLAEFDPVIQEHVQQMSLIIRYMNTSSGHVSIEESFLGFSDVSDTTGKGLFDVLQNELKQLDLNIDDVRGQGYDNRSNMKGCNKGVKTKILDVNPRAFYSACGCHSLNLTLCDMAKNCATRWESRVESVKAIRFQCADIRVALLQVSNIENDVKTSGEAKVSKQLQSKDMLIDVAIEEVEGLIAFFKRYMKLVS
uniref:Uncharacterized protein n=1 Tax=Setaria viridis TaxID=4556 RepID=A0A4U6TEH0_SETVI|nr:hypothetical protein SEVIR_8G040400v2 [Setaria viridis]